ncbi:Phosphatases II [Mycena indigotica]|uniref:protein-tyrosine-phosphatase n=1 Tax=Mycena indigotica TaxID=2126181 RepID=A0A8H6WF41_9AGAR|nr:Phosphatases II [Mycena indigotica]KAF7310134.1 Phosphatases II [Mycena indigotica]
MLLSFENLPKDEMEAMCTPMHCILPASGSSRHTSRQNALHGDSTRSDSHLAPEDSRSAAAAGTGALYLGSMAAVFELELLREHDITHLVQVLETPWAPQPESGEGHDQLKLAYHRIDIEDSTAAGLRLGGYLAPACDYIKDALGRGENVLVHCHQGVSRSAAVVIAFLIRERSMDYDEAYAFVKRKRSCIRPNAGFVQALHEWEAACEKARKKPRPRSAVSSTSSCICTTSTFSNHSLPFIHELHTHLKLPGSNCIRVISPVVYWILVRVEMRAVLGVVCQVRSLRESPADEESAQIHTGATTH